VVRRAELEIKRWPYSWLNNTAYQSRGELSGRFVLSNGRPAAGASVVLGDNHSNSSTLDQGQSYRYVATTDVDGWFHMAHVRSGIYALYAWPSGDGIKEVTTQYAQNDVTVKPNIPIQLGSLVWKTDARGKEIFQIGAFDRKTLGFKNGGAPYQHGLVEQSPANLTYTVGDSKESDWYFAQSALGAWTVRFLLEDGDTLFDESEAILSVSFAGYSKGASMKIIVNSKIIRNLRGSEMPSDPALYRSGSTAGEWHLFNLELKSGVLKRGWNEIVFEIVATKLWKGFMWDSIKLSWKR
jgi:rhamnogalacturonan endolyase